MRRPQNKLRKAAKTKKIVVLNPSPHKSPHRPHAMEEANWAVERVTGLPEFWANVAKYRGIVGTCQLMRVCKASIAGGKEHLRTLPGLVVCGGLMGQSAVSDVLRLDLATMRWEPMAALVTARFAHACCAVRGDLVVLGGRTPGGRRTLSVGNAFFFRGGGRGVCGTPADVMLQSR